MKKKAVPSLALFVQEGADGDLACLGCDPSDLFQASVLSQVVFCVLVLRLAQDKIVDLHQDLRSLPLFSRGIGSAPRSLTLAQLLSHTAGIEPLFLPAYPNGVALPSPLQMLHGESPAKNPPLSRSRIQETRGVFSAGGFLAAQCAVEYLTGSDLETLAQAYVFQPLAMQDSTFSPHPPREPLAGHGHFGQRLRDAYLVHPACASDGLWISARDLSRFLQLFSPDSTFLREEYRDRLTMGYHKSEYSLSLRKGLQGETVCWQLGGGSQGYQAKLLHFPAEHRSIAMLANANSAFPVMLSTQYALYQALGWPYLPKEPKEKRRPYTHADQI